jgi:hypothetical protein
MQFLPTNHKAKTGLVIGTVCLAILLGSGVEAVGALVAHYRLDESSGTIAADETGHYDGTYNGSPAYSQAGAATGTGTCIGFSGDDYVENTTLPGMNQLSVAFWVYLDSTWTAYSMIAARTPTYNNPWTIQVEPGSGSTRQVCWIEGRANCNYVTVNTDQWVHVAITTENAGGMVRTYLSGALAAEQSAPGFTDDGTAPFYIGRRDDIYFFHGYIDDFQVYNTALPATDVQWLYNHPGQSMSGGYILMPDDFEDYDTSGFSTKWTSSDTIALETGQTHDDSGQAMRLTYTSGATVTKDPGWSTDLSVQQGQYAAIWFKADAANPDAKDIVLRFKDSGGNPVGQAIAAGGTGITEWTVILVEITDAGGWSDVRYAEIEVDAASSYGTIYFDDLTFVAPGQLSVPSDLYFGSPDIGQSVTKSLYIENIGGLPVNVSSVAVTDADSSYFELLGPTAPFVVAPGPENKVEVSIRFTPDAQRQYSASLEIESGAGNETVALTGRVFEPLILHTRRQEETAPASGQWTVIEETNQWDPQETAIIVCDMWNSHPWAYLADNVGMMAVRMNQVLKDARSKGLTIVYCPSGVQSYYSGTPGKVMMQSAPYTAYPPGIDDGWNSPQAWELNEYSHIEIGTSETPTNGPAITKQNPALEIFDGDGITESGQECYNLFMDRGIRNVMVMGVHANWCVMGRSFGVRQWHYIKDAVPGENWNVVVVRDLVDTGVGVGDTVTVHGVPGYITCHDRATDMIVAHMEKFWCPSIASDDLRFDPPSQPVLFIDNEFDDGQLYWGYNGLKDFRIGGGLYNVSQDNNWHVVAGAATETAAAGESDGLLTLTTQAGSSNIAAVMTRTMFTHQDSAYPAGTEIRWVVQSVSGFYAGDHVGQGFCLGVIDAGGPVGLPAPSALDTPQLYLTIRDHDSDGKPDGEVCWSGPTGQIHQVISGATYEFDSWDGASGLLTATMILAQDTFVVTFSLPVNGGVYTVSGAMPDAFDQVGLVNAFASLQDLGGHNVKLDRLTVLRRTLGDLNGDLAVDLEDVALLATYWLVDYR